MTDRIKRGGNVQANKGSEAPVISSRVKQLEKRRFHGVAGTESGLKWAEVCRTKQTCALS